jgi:hypothetical protein
MLRACSTVFLFGHLSFSFSCSLREVCVLRTDLIMDQSVGSPVSPVETQSLSSPPQNPVTPEPGLITRNLCMNLVTNSVQFSISALKKAVGFHSLLGGTSCLSQLQPASALVSLYHYLCGIHKITMALPRTMDLPLYCLAGASHPPCWPYCTHS